MHTKSHHVKMMANAASCAATGANNDVLNPERQRLLQFAGLARQFVHGEGVWLTDSDGRRFLDAYAQYGALALGYNAEPVKAAICEALQAGVPAMVQPYAAIHAESLARELYKLGRNNFSRCVFTTSGAETVEAAIKLVRMRSGRPIILSAQGSYHGKTMGALAASDRLDFASQHQHEAQGFARVAYGDITALEHFLQAHGEHTAGFIVEPIQGERGVFEPPPDYLKTAKQLCAKYGVAFIADEIQTGLFRTGAAFAIDRAEVVPDVLLIAKALGGGLFPIGACLVNESTWDPVFAMSHSSTFANNNLAAIAGLATLRELQKPAFQQNIDCISELLNSGLNELARRFPLAVIAIRGRGLMRAVELRAPDASAGYFLTYLHQQELSAYMFASVMASHHGVLVLPALNNSNVIRIAPPLVSQPEHIGQLLAALADTLALWESRASDKIALAIMPAAATNQLPKQTIRQLRNAQINMAPTVWLPPKKRSANDKKIDYAFIIHPTAVDDIVLNDPSFAHFSSNEFARYLDYSSRLPAGVVCDIPEIVSPTGASARGVLIGLPLLPTQMAARGRDAASKAIAQAVDLAKNRGAKIVGLGAFTSIYTRKGSTVTGRGPAITTGNLLTAGTTVNALQSLLEDRHMSLANCRVGIVGARGSVGLLIAQLIARIAPLEIRLVGNPNSDIAGINRIAEQLRNLGKSAVTTSTDIAAVENCDVIISASSSTATILDQAGIKSGTIICDVARPFDTSPAMRARRDITIIDAGLVELPVARNGKPIQIGLANLQGLPAGVALACLSETILLALACDGCSSIKDYGIGDDLHFSEVDAMLALARAHGFSLSQYGLRGSQPISHVLNTQAGKAYALGYAVAGAE